MIKGGTIGGATVKARGLGDKCKGPELLARNRKTQFCIFHEFQIEFNWRQSCA